MNLNNSATVICMALPSIQAVKTNYCSRLMLIKACRSPLEVSSLLDLRIQSHSHWDIIAQNLYRYLKFRMSYWFSSSSYFPFNALLAHCTAHLNSLAVGIACHFLHNRTGPVETFGCKCTGKVVVEATITSLAHFKREEQG